MGGTLKSAMPCGCEFWEYLNHMGELVPDFNPCKNHFSIREIQLEVEHEFALGLIKGFYKCATPIFSLMMKNLPQINKEILTDIRRFKSLMQTAKHILIKGNV